MRKMPKDCEKAFLKKLESDCCKLLIKQPFIGTVLLSLELRCDLTCETAATDGMRIKVNPVFYLSLSQDERLFVLAHETWHVILLHFARCQNRQHELFNIAADLEIHFILKKDKFKEPFVLPHKPEWATWTMEEIYDYL